MRASEATSTCRSPGRGARHAGRCRRARRDTSALGTARRMTAVARFRGLRVEGSGGCRIPVTFSRHDLPFDYRGPTLGQLPKTVEAWPRGRDMRHMHGWRSRAHATGGGRVRPKPGSASLRVVRIRDGRVGGRGAGADRWAQASAWVGARDRRAGGYVARVGAHDGGAGARARGPSRIRDRQQTSPSRATTGSNASPRRGARVPLDPALARPHSPLGVAMPRLLRRKRSRLRHSS